MSHEGNDYLIDIIRDELEEAPESGHIVLSLCSITRPIKSARPDGLRFDNNGHLSPSGTYEDLDALSDAKYIADHEEEDDDE